MRFQYLALLAAATGFAAAAPAKGHAKRASPFRWFGSNEAGAEFGESNLPGVWGTDYIFPDPSTIQTLIGKGMNIFRNLTSVSKEAFWKTVVGEFKSNKRVIFDTNNEYHDMDQDLVLRLNQAAIDGIRGAGATTQYIFVEGNSWSGAWTWKDINDNMKDLTHPQDKIVYEMHQYLDSDGSGTNEACVSTTIGAERVAGATQWLKDNGKVGILGEFAGVVNDQCKTAITGMLDYLAGQTEVWLGGGGVVVGSWAVVGRLYV
ncbi:CAZyme family GH5 [Penicillium alfredii]|uniref:cellulase n=1 Tax=Penicillium alfredii TaxID=1506179 RepID=A0A9W9F912_9EURO|nr:CAZyme family GH5 [Penicillium alfredii]KAJ5095841.1 CAZyme family GH5 [Penicillium alfredii]